jgi:hypothetical protein
MQCWRIALTVSALAIGHDRIIEPDVLKKDIEKYVKADDAGKQRLHTKATKRRNRGRGWTIGRHESVQQLAVRRSGSSGAPDEKRGELTHSHFRSGHLHGYHTKEGYIIKWIPQLTVRPDLPLDPKKSKGYNMD